MRRANSHTSGANDLAKRLAFNVTTVHLLRPDLSGLSGFRAHLHTCVSVVQVLGAGSNGEFFSLWTENDSYFRAFFLIWTVI